MKNIAFHIRTITGQLFEPLPFTPEQWLHNFSTDDKIFPDTTYEFRMPSGCDLLIRGDKIDYIMKGIK